MKQIPVLIFLSLVISLCNLTQKLTGNKNDNSNSNQATANSNSKGGGDLPPADKPEPTAAQTAALEGGQQVSWDQQGITWMLPAKWSEVSKSTKDSFNWKSPGSGDAAFIIASISAMGGDFPTDVSLKAFYDQAVTRQKNGEVSEVHWLELDGVRGVEFLETPPEAKDGIRRLQWITYRKYAGQSQMVNLILSTEGQYFDKHKDELFAILYSTKLVH
ncbi:MAG: hypothetical protein JOZ52_11135 [Acidobacteria bacterium]|nr:hypothetical protein [Acidobacteriota bacterium]